MEGERREKAIASHSRWRKDNIKARGGEGEGKESVGLWLGLGRGNDD